MRGKEGQAVRGCVGALGMGEGMGVAKKIGVTGAGGWVGGREGGRAGELTEP